MGRIWDKIISEEEIAIYLKAGFHGENSGIGNKPALLIIDVQYRTLGINAPILESINESGYNSSCGKVAWASLQHIKQLLNVVRSKNIPVIYAIVERKNKFDAGRWADKIPGFGSSDIHRIGHRGTEIIEEIKPLDDDIIISKRYASAFLALH